MNFKQLKTLYKKHLARQGIFPTPVELDEIVAERILEPFESFKDALDHAHQGMVLHTVEGFEVSPTAIDDAVKILSQ